MFNRFFNGTILAFTFLAIFLFPVLTRAEKVNKIEGSEVQAGDNEVDSDNAKQTAFDGKVTLSGVDLYIKTLDAPGIDPENPDITWQFKSFGNQTGPYYVDYLSGLNSLMPSFDESKAPDELVFKAPVVTVDSNLSSIILEGNLKPIGGSGGSGGTPPIGHWASSIAKVAITKIIGSNSAGTGQVEVTTTSVAVITTATLKLNGVIESTKTNINGGTFNLSLDFNKLINKQTNTIDVAITSGGKTITATATAVGQDNPLAHDNEVLLYFFVGPGLGATGFHTLMYGASTKFDWSVTQVGQTSVVYTINGAKDHQIWDVVSTAPAAGAWGVSFVVSGSTTWAPAPITLPMATPTFPVFTAPGDKSVGTEPGVNWWFTPKVGNNIATITVIAVTVNGVVPGTPINSSTDIIYP